MAKYPGIEVPEKPVAGALALKNNTVLKVVDAFSRIPSYGQANHAYLGETFGNNDVYIGGINNHFQGIARHKDGQHFILSGGDSLGKNAHLLIIKMQSYLKNAGSDPDHITGPVRSNLISRDDRELEDEIVELFFLDNTYWHAGGISMMGDILVVPLESDVNSKIVFVDIRNPVKPAMIHNFINRDQEGQKVGAASAVQLKNKHILCAAWTESGDLGHRFDFYLSNEPKVGSSFDGPVSVKLETFKNLKNEIPRFQSIQFVEQKNGEIYIVGTDNRGKLGSGSNRRFLMHIKAQNDTMADSPSLKEPEVTIFPSMGIMEGRSYYNFNSAGGIYVDHCNNIVIYGAATFRRGFGGKRLNFAEFYPKIPNSGPECEHIQFGVIELYTELNCEGRYLALQVHRENDLSNYKKIKIAGQNLDDAVKSIRHKLPEGFKYEFYEDRNFNGTRTNKRKLIITGTGETEELRFLNDPNTPGLIPKIAFSGEISSSRKV